MTFLPLIQAGFGIASLFGDDPAKKMQKQQQALIDKNIHKVNQGFQRFDDRFFATARQNYIEAHQPKLERYFKDQHRQNLFGTARKGQLGSSQEIERTQNLKAAEVSQRNALADQALAYEQDLRLKIEDQRQNLVQQAYSIPNSNLIDIATQKRQQALQITPFQLGSFQMPQSQTNYPPPTPAFSGDQSQNHQFFQ